VGKVVAKGVPIPQSLDSLETIWVEHARFYFGAYLNISIAVWVGQADLNAAQAMLRASDGMAQRNPRGHSSVNFVLDGLAGPTPEAQPIFKQLLGRRAQLACAAIILEGSGFWASGLRGMLSNTHREAGGGVPLKIETSVDPLVGWFSEQHQARTKVELQPMQLRDVLLHARQLGERAARG
jgi:hypothetical protein